MKLANFLFLLSLSVSNSYAQHMPREGHLSREEMREYRDRITAASTIEEKTAIKKEMHLKKKIGADVKGFVRSASKVDGVENEGKLSLIEEWKNAKSMEERKEISQKFHETIKDLPMEERREKAIEFREALKSVSDPTEFLPKTRKSVYKNHPDPAMRARMDMPNRPSMEEMDRFHESIKDLPPDERKQKMIEFRKKYAPPHRV